MDRNCFGRSRHCRDRCEALERIVGGGRLDQRLDDKILVYDEDRVAVCRGAPRRYRTNRASGTRQIFILWLS